MRKKTLVALCFKSKVARKAWPSASVVSISPGGGGVLPYKRLMRICRWMGPHFHDWIDYNDVAFSIESLEWGRTFSVLFKINTSRFTCNACGIIGIGLH